MKISELLQALSLLTLATARPTGKLAAREVPQEHSHEQFLTTVRTFLQTNNPAGIVDPVFGLLGDAAAAGGKGSITDVECLQQATADQAFTNAKAAGSIDGMVGALVYRALERNTQGIGTKSNPCTSIKAVNPEIAALSQHQDPASDGAAAANKAVALELAVQINSVGGDPQIAIKSGTFAPGSKTDLTGKGNTCDDANDATGCIFTQNLLVPDVTADEIVAAVGSGSSGAATATDTSTATTSAAAPPPSETSASVDPSECEAPPPPPPPPTECAAPPPEDTTVASSAPTASSTLDFGSCTNPGIVFGAGFDGRKEDSFEPADTTEFTHGSALNIVVITGFICDRFRDTCKAPTATQDACTAAQAATVGLTGQAAADAWNAALGLSSSSVSSGAAPATSSTAAAPPPTSTTPTPTTSSDFGSCSGANPDIVFGPGFDGRNTDSFEPSDPTTFPHGSALGIGVITSFICQQLNDKCKASATVLAACASGSAAAAAASGQAAADAFNAAFA